MTEPHTEPQTMLERMARAGYHTGGKFPSWEDAPQAVRDMAILRVRAELELLKEPSKGMKQYALREADCPALPVDEWEALQAFWVAMLNAILKEDK